MLGTRDGIPFIPTVMDFKQAAVVKEIFTFRMVSWTLEENLNV